MFTFRRKKFRDTVACSFVCGNLSQLKRVKGGHWFRATIYRPVRLPSPCDTLPRPSTAELAQHKENPIPHNHCKPLISDATVHDVLAPPQLHHPSPVGRDASALPLTCSQSKLERAASLAVALHPSLVQRRGPPLSAALGSLPRPAALGHLPTAATQATPQTAGGCARGFSTCGARLRQRRAAPSTGRRQHATS